jgi:hypothetical protein
MAVAVGVEGVFTTMTPKVGPPKPTDHPVPFWAVCNEQ